jgi:curved DNA-binding protein CbpA
LGITFDDSQNPDKLKKAYRDLALKHHPDKGGNEEHFKKINAAHEFILEHSENIYNYEPAPKKTVKDASDA